MTLYRGFDAAFPPSKRYPSCQWAGGYIGGNTPNVWTLDEWNRFTGPNFRVCPIWTGYHQNDPGDHAKAAVKAALALGWRAHATPLRLIALDFEGEVDAEWITAFAAQLRNDGFDTCPYASLSAISGGDPPELGYWLPDWNGFPVIPSQPPHVIAHQFEGDVPFMGTSVDVSVGDDTFWNGLGRGVRHVVS